MYNSVGVINSLSNALAIDNSYTLIKINNAEQASTNIMGIYQPPS